MQVIRTKHKLKAFAFAAKAPKGCAAGVTLALGNNTLEVRSCACPCSILCLTHQNLLAGRPLAVCYGRGMAAKRRTIV